MNDDYNNYVYASVDGGKNFRSISESIPRGQVVMTVAEDPKNPAVLYAGTEFGLFVSTDRGGSWNRVRSGLPTVPIHEIVFHPRENDMILATHGRSIWILDDATPIQQAAEAMRSGRVPVRLRRQAMQFNPANDRGFVTDKPFRGKNPTFGAPISYYLKGAASGQRLAAHPRRVGQLRCASSPATICATRPRPGINRVYWDLRYQPLPAPAGAPAAGGGGGGGGGGLAAAAATTDRSSCPANTASRWSSSGKDIATKSVRVVGDTAVQMTDADRKTWHDTALALHRLQEQANEAADAVTQLGTQYQSLEDADEGRRPTRRPRRRSAIEAAGKQLADLRRRLGVAAPGQGDGGRGGGWWWRRGGGGGGQHQNVRGADRPDQGSDHELALAAERAADARADGGPRGSDGGHRRHQRAHHDDAEALRQDRRQRRSSRRRSNRCGRSVRRVSRTWG